ncbi:MAG: GAF domain-containing protein, partial [Alphaproteobacteria bacterium]|nr:GAF domain-containing protein [Alphaproteobacteria bacterium]
MSISAALSGVLGVQRVISEQVTTQKDVPDRVSQILQAFKNLLNADSAALYAVVDGNYLEQMGTCGVFSYKSTIRFGDDNMGACAANRRTINSFNQDNKEALLCIPVVRMYKAFGVMAFQKNNRGEFSDEAVTMAETLSLSLSDVLSSKPFAQYRNYVIRSKGIVISDSLKGVCLNKGYGVGRALLHRKHRELVNIFAENIETEQFRLEEGRRKMSEYLDQKIAQTESSIGNSVKIMEA